MPILTNEEFRNKYHFPKPIDNRERDVQLMSVLNDMAMTSDSERRREIAESAKAYIMDTEDVREISWWKARGFETQEEILEHKLKQVS